MTTLEIILLTLLLVSLSLDLFLYKSKKAQKQENEQLNAFLKDRLQQLRKKIDKNEIKLNDKGELE